MGFEDEVEQCGMSPTCQSQKFGSDEFAGGTGASRRMGGTIGHGRLMFAVSQLSEVAVTEEALAEGSHAKGDILKQSALLHHTKEV
jgi:hypothetical protein